MPHDTPASAAPATARAAGTPRVRDVLRSPRLLRTETLAGLVVALALIGQGVANVVTGFFGGMGGCAMIGETMINVKASGARRPR